MRVLATVRLVAFILPGFGSCFAQALTWTQQNPITSPAPRSSSAMVYDAARAQVVLFGGTITSGSVNDTWIWDGTNWTQQFPATSPPARAAHAMAYDAAHNQVVLFGGSTSGGPLNDTWIWDGVNWTQKSPSASPPARWNGGYLAYDQAHSQVVLFGGTTIVDGLNTNVNDTWTWNGTNWTQQFPATSPPPRSAHALTYDAVNNQVVTFGGSGSGSGSPVILSDTWVWDGTTWTQKSPSTIPTSPRWDYTLAYDALDHRTLLVGGGTPSGTSWGDTWAWDGTNWTQLSVGTPGARAGQAMAYDATDSELVLFGGGSGSTILGDTWALGSPSCSPPQTITVDDSGTAGLISATASSTEVIGGELTATVTIHNPLRFWLGLLGQSSSVGAAAEPSPPSLLTPCASEPFILGCPDPGGATFTVEFCSPGAITLEYGETPQSAGATYADAVSPVSRETIASLVESLQSVPDWVKLEQCFSPLSLSTAACLATGVLNLIWDPRQLEEVVAIFNQARITITVGMLISDLTLFLGSGETLEDLLRFVIETKNAGHLDTVSIKIVGQ